LRQLAGQETLGACSSRADLVVENGKSVMRMGSTSLARAYTDPSIDEYLRERLMPVILFPLCRRSL